MSNLIKAIRFNYRDTEDIDDETLLSYWSALGVAKTLYDCEPLVSLAKGMGMFPTGRLNNIHPVILFEYTNELCKLLNEVEAEARLPLTRDMPSVVRGLKPYSESHLFRDAPVYAQCQTEEQRLAKEKLDRGIACEPNPTVIEKPAYKAPPKPP